MNRLSLLVAGLLCALAPAVAEAGLVSVRTVERSITVDRGATRLLTLSCPGTTVAVSGAATSGLGTLIDSIPRPGIKRWSFRFRASADARRVTGVLRCVRLRIPDRVAGVSVAVGTALKPRVGVPARGTRRVAVDCPGRQLPTGWGFKRGGRGRAILLAGALPSPTGWVFRFENRGRRAASVTPRIRCLGRTQRAFTGQTHRFSLRSPSFSDLVGPGPVELSHACRPGEFSLATGVSLNAADDISLSATYPAGLRAARWSLRQPRGGSRVATTLLCLAGDTRFR